MENQVDVFIEFYLATSFNEAVGFILLSLLATHDLQICLKIVDPNEVLILEINALHWVSL